MVAGRPQFYTLRRTFKKSEICAYILGVLLAVTFVLIWPALMLFKKLFSKTDYEQWTNVVSIKCIVNKFTDNTTTGTKGAIDVAGDTVKAGASVPH